MLDLSEVARMLVAPGKGLLAADESNTSADDKRLKLYGIPTGPEMRREFRDLFLETPGIAEYLSGVILFSETMDQKDDEDGLYFPESLKKQGIIPGIKVDEGLEPFPDSPNETITKGLVGLPERVAEFKARHNPGFTKWRAAITIEGDQLPTSQALVENAKRLALYAYEVQKAGMVPIVEPEVLLDGNHSRLRAREVITKTMNALVSAMEDHAVDLEAVIVWIPYRLPFPASYSFPVAKQLTKRLIIYAPLPDARRNYKPRGRLRFHTLELYNLRPLRRGEVKRRTFRSHGKRSSPA